MYYVKMQSYATTWEISRLLEPPITANNGIWHTTFSRYRKFNGSFSLYSTRSIIYTESITARLRLLTQRTASGLYITESNYSRKKQNAHIAKKKTQLAEKETTCNAPRLIYDNSTPDLTIQTFFLDLQAICL